ncbi:MAG: 3-phosphoserine/phosphohydroxythreonine transaminase [Phycisphaerales bacterium]|nr:3-phosphoserine/phosphohydroxythreonine transaminase [Phycisphaerales bacterium]
MSTDRVFNFSAGPAALPEPVIQQAQKDLWNFKGSGMGVLELSHRGKWFDGILEEAEADCREIGKVPNNYRVLFLQGGATTQADMIPMSFLGKGQTADYVDTGKWAADAVGEAQRHAKNIGASVNVAGSSKNDNYCHLPKSYNFTKNAAYCLYVSNNTIFGTQFQAPPDAPAPLIGDMSSDFFSRPMDIKRHAMLYGGAQKNLGPAGQALVIVSDEFLAKAPKDTLGKMFDYQVQAAKESRYNTPNTFAIYLMGQVFKWIKKEFGSLEQAETYNRDKARLIYDAIDNSDFFEAHVKEQADRSYMNIPFKSPTPELDALFAKEAEAKGFTTLDGHRSIGGMRASIYNAFPVEGCRKFAEFMRAFEREHAGKTTVAAR